MRPIEKAIRMTCATILTTVSLMGCSMEKPKMREASTPASTATIVVPTPYSPSRFLVPTTINTGVQVLLYNQGVIANATRGIDLDVWIDILQRINTDPAFGINLNSDEQNITYLFPQSFANDNKRLDAIKQAEEEYPTLLSVLDSRYGINHGRARFSIISVADVLNNVIRMNPGLTPANPNFQAAVSVELGNAYLGITGAKIFDANDTPKKYPEISASLRAKLFESRAYPFDITAVDQGYLAALNLFYPATGKLF